MDKLDERISQFEAENPNIKVTYYDSKREVLVKRSTIIVLGVSAFIFGFFIGSS